MYFKNNLSENLLHFSPDWYLFLVGAFVLDLENLKQKKMCLEFSRQSGLFGLNNETSFIRQARMQLGLLISKQQ